MKTSSKSWMPVDYTIADAAAIKALDQGTATPEQQRRALIWITQKAAGLLEWPYQPGENDRDTNIFLGRHFVAHQITKMLKLDLSKVKMDPRSDPIEPKA
jgi:hypothetical protein